MSIGIAEELEKLQGLFDKGTLNTDELARAKSKVLGDAGNSLSVQQFRRSKSDRIFGGVCGGLGKISAMPAWAWRIIFCVCFFGMGFGFLIYVLLWLFVPQE